MEVFKRSIGQGNLFSIPSHAVSDACGPTVVHRLISRTLTGRGLHVRVHQHFAHHLHINWDGRRTRSRSRSEMCMERKFPFCGDLDELSLHLSNSALEGLCDCVLETIKHHITDKVTQCERRPNFTSHEFTRHPTWKIKEIQDDTGLFHCRCHVTSSTEPVFSSF